MIRLILTFLVTLILGEAHCQRMIKGFVMSEMGEPIPFAHVQDIHTLNHNTTSNEHGEFEISLSDSTYALRVSAINYKTEEFDVTITPVSDRLEFVLTHNLNTYNEVVILSGEDPGVRKMREVIKKRKQHADYLQSLVTDVYLKGNLKIVEFPKFIMGQPVTDTMLKEMGLDSSGQGIVYLLEQNTKYYYQAPDKTFNEVISVRTSGDPQGLGFAQMPAIINIYDNNVHILEGLTPRGIISPAHSNAFHYYDFRLVENFFENEKMISKIRVTPKRKYEPLFTGYVYVVEDDWIFHSLELSVDRSAGIDLLDSISLLQSYTNLQADQWVIKNQVILPEIKLMGIKISGSFLTHYTHLSINQSIDPNRFNSKLISVYDTAALDRDSAYWEENRKVPLTELEQNNFVKGDSLLSFTRLNDSLYKANSHVYVDPISILTTGGRVVKHPHEWGWNGLLDIVQFNNVEGLNLTLKPYWKTAVNDYTTSELSARIRYGFASEKLYYSLKERWQISDKNNKLRFWQIDAEGGKYISDISQLMPISETYNTYTALSGYNYLSFYEKNYAKLTVNRHLGNGWTFKVSGTYEDRRPLENNTNYTWFKASNEYIKPNNPSNLSEFLAHKAFIVQADIRYQSGWKYIQYPKHLQVIKSNAPVWRLSYVKGIPNIMGSDVDFDKLIVGMQSTINMKLLGRLDLNFEGGTFLNKKSVGNPDLFHNRGNKIWLANDYLNSFQLADYYALSHKDSYLKLHAEWHLNGLLSNKIPLINKLNWHFVISSNTLFITPNNYYTEIAFGIENIGYKMYKLGRVDFVMGNNAQDKSKYYGIKIGFSGILTQMVSVN